MIPAATPGWTARCDLSGRGPSLPTSSIGRGTLARVRMVGATRYQTPRWEGGSLPALVEADDRLYVLDVHGDGQGR